MKQAADQKNQQDSIMR